MVVRMNEILHLRAKEAIGSALANHGRFGRATWSLVVQRSTRRTPAGGRGHAAGGPSYLRS